MKNDKENFKKSANLWIEERFLAIESNNVDIERFKKLIENHKRLIELMQEQNDLSKTWVIEYIEILKKEDVEIDSKYLKFFIGE